MRLVDPEGPELGRMGHRNSEVFGDTKESTTGPTMSQLRIFYTLHDPDTSLKSHCPPRPSAWICCSGAGKQILIQNGKQSQVHVWKILPTWGVCSVFFPIGVTLSQFHGVKAFSLRGAGWIPDSPSEAVVPQTRWILHGYDPPPTSKRSWRT